MLNDNEIDFLAWVDYNYYSELEPGDEVKYEGGFLKLRGVWIVHERIDDDRYTLKLPSNEYARLNADRRDLVPVDQGELPL